MENKDVACDNLQEVEGKTNQQEFTIQEKYFFCDIEHSNSSEFWVLSDN